MDPQAPETHITEISERWGCLRVQGVVKKDGAWVKADVQVSKEGILHMSKQEFERFILRRLPEFTVDQDWRAHTAGREGCNPLPTSARASAATVGGRKPYFSAVTRARAGSGVFVCAEGEIT